LLGWAGGLIPDLAAGEVLCANTAVRTGRPDLTVMPLAITGLRTGAILTSPQALLTMAQKQAAQSSGAIAVEMEAYPFAEWAYTHGIPFTHGRVILDTMFESVPDMGQALDAFGQLRLPSFLAQLVKYPELIPEIWQLFKRTRSLNPILEKLALDLVRLI
jgi:adenosylhomocysteine nucleosidase